MEENSFILTVDRNRQNLKLLAQFLNQEGYQTLSAASLEEFYQNLTKGEQIKLVLLDISGFDRRIWECCQQMQDLQIPFLVLSSRQSTAIQQESIAHGACSMLIKPLVVKDLLGIIYGLLGK